MTRGQYDFEARPNIAATDARRSIFWKLYEKVALIMDIPEAACFTGKGEYLWKEEKEQKYIYCIDV